MPLSPPKPRKPVHNRKIDITGYERDDGLWDIEGFLVDSKAEIFTSHAHDPIPAGAPVHGMGIRLTIDFDFLVHEAEAITDHAPFPGCFQAAPDMAHLKGLRIGKGFNEEARRLFAGTKGCTHLVEMLVPMASTAFQTLWPIRQEKGQNDQDGKRPKLIDSCHALASDGAVTKRVWPAYYTGP